MQGLPPVTDDIKLRLLEEADAEELHALIETNRAYLAPWLPWATGQSVEDTLGFIRGTLSQASDNEGFKAAIVLAGSIVRVVGFVTVDRANRSTRIGYWLDESNRATGR